jgi:exopolyphosphatase / guanosine-5'-triphosphate,3'-diphosphate pyrophosphatase
MESIVPRWEWRTFGRRFGPAEERFARMAPGAVQESDETYFLTGSKASAKVRDGLMDIKILREVNAEGLERWEPVLKQPFPLAAADVARTLGLLGLDAGRLARAQYTVEQFVAEFPSLRPLNVHKHRVRYTVGGCMAELSDIRADGRASRTIAIESENADAVLSAVASIGLQGYLNTNFPSGLRRLLDGTPERYAVIDVGTNSIKFHVAERRRGEWRTIADRAELTRLGEGLEKSGEISREAAERTSDAIAEMVTEAKRHEVRAIAAVGTAGLRIASNRSEVLGLIRSRAGIPVEVISGEEESRLAFLAVKHGLQKASGSLVVFDTGGGSTQFTFGKDDCVEERFSLNVGAVRYTEKFSLAGTVDEDQLQSALAQIAADLSRIDGRNSPEQLVGMGGAVTSLAAVRHAMATYDPDIVQGTILDRSEIDRQIEMYRSSDAEQRRSIVGLQPKRAEVILAGACIVRTVMDKLDCAMLIVSDRGLRHGVLVERFGVTEKARVAEPA